MSERRQRGVRRLFLAGDDCVEVFADPIELAWTTRRKPVLALKPKAQAEVHQLEDRQEIAGVRLELVQQNEEALAAAHFLMER